MDEQLAEFLHLCDVALARANEIAQDLQRSGASQGKQEMAVLTVSILEQIKESALAGRLPRPSGGAGLGLTRGIGEWTEDEALTKAARAAERFYRDRM